MSLFQSNFFSIILIEILIRLTACHTSLLKLVTRIWLCIKTIFSCWWCSSISLPICKSMCCYCTTKKLNICRPNLSHKCSSKTYVIVFALTINCPLFFNTVARRNWTTISGTLISIPASSDLIPVKKILLKRPFCRLDSNISKIKTFTKQF